jgi:hypothetical protein
MSNPEIGSALVKFLRRYAGRHRGIRLTWGWGFTALFFLCPLPVACLFDRFLIVPDWVRILTWVIYVLVVGGLFGWLVVRPFLRRYSDLETAFAVGDQAPETHHLLAAAGAPVDRMGARGLRVADRPPPRAGIGLS